MIVSEEDNRGVRQLYRVHLPPHRPAPPHHYHQAFTETFTVVEGALDFFLGREARHILLTPNESATAQIGEIHTFANDHDEPVTVMVETKPAGGVVRAFQLAYGIANAGGAASDGLPKNWLVRLRFIEISQGFLPRVPRFLQQAVFGIAAWISNVTGVEKRLTRYFDSPE
jgi:quercetin dioxygenase-like cupin family protein